MIPGAVFVFAGVALSGCTTSGLAMFGADAVTQATSGRSITGNVLYAMTGKECQPFNLLTGKPMCRDEETAEAAKEEAPIYCYRTLGQVDCHVEPDPMKSSTTRLYRTEVKVPAKTMTTATTAEAKP